MNEVKRLFDIPYYQQQKWPLHQALVTKHNGVWQKTSTQQYIQKMNALSCALLKMGVHTNDKIAIISSNNQTLWHIVDMAILQVGAQNVPIYPTISIDDYEYIFNHSQVRFAFVSDKQLYDRIHSIKERLPFLEEIFSFVPIDGVRNTLELIAEGECLSNHTELKERAAQITEDDFATLIYTSGTTDRPKGVMLSHKNIISNFKNCQDRLPLGYKSVAMSFLPTCHIFERTLTYLYQYNGISIWFAESIEKIGDNIREVRPHLITVVPRLVEKIYDKIYSKGTALKGLKRMMFFWAVRLGSQYKPYGENGWWYELQLKIARRLVFSKWSEALGGRIELIVSGSAALQPRLTRMFCAANLPIMEGYGLTETSPTISVNRVKDRFLKIGTVGKPIKNVEVKIAEDGEILCKSDSVMMGYYKNPELTQEVITDGFFHTGDVGEIDAEGFLRITDRKKEMFKTSGGKYISPQLIENLLKQSRFIEQAMVIGEGEKMPGAFIQVDFDFVKEWAKRHNLSLKTYSEVAHHPSVKERIAQEINRINKKIGKWEQIKVFRIMSEPWSVDTGHLTPTLKLKRKVILKKHSDLYQEMYPKDVDNE